MNELSTIRTRLLARTTTLTRGFWRGLVWAAFAAAFAASASGQVAARPKPLLPTRPDAGDPPTSYLAQRGGISLAQATSMAASRYQGRVAGARTVNYGDRAIHEIKILGADGRVKTVRIDAQTGMFL